MVLNIIRRIISASYRLLSIAANIKPRSVEELHNYWENPDNNNDPAGYVQHEQRSLFLLDLLKQYVSPQSSILEIGCNVGRNLHYLYQASFRNLVGIEINSKAVDLLRATFPELVEIPVQIEPVESALPKTPDNSFDIIFTMATLEHVHPESAWIFQEMARVAREYIITIEDEKVKIWRSFPRNYRHVFERLGFYQVSEAGCDNIEGLGKTMIARVLRKSSAKFLKG